MELNPIGLTRNAAWYALNKTGMAGVARAVIYCCIPSQQVKNLLQSQAERQKRREAIMLQGAGELELQVQKGLIVLNEEVREQLWTAVKSGNSGVEFADVFDPHVADFLENTTPGGLSDKKVSPTAQI